ncbi:MAG: hypothetical protein AAF098_19490 [Pseudomonadota bacterium]
MDLEELEPVAWIRSDDIEKCKTSECCVSAYSVQMAYLDGEESIPVYEHTLLAHAKALEAKVGALERAIRDAGSKLDIWYADEDGPNNDLIDDARIVLGKALTQSTEGE